MRRPTCLVALLLWLSNAHAENILVVGDSHTCGSFGQVLAQTLVSAGLDVTTFCAVSSAPYDWLHGRTPAGQKCYTWQNNGTPRLCNSKGTVPTIAKILAQSHFSSAIVALGTNSLLSPPDVSYPQLVSAITSQKVACHWIGPPHLRPDQARGFPVKRLQTMEQNLANFYQVMSQDFGTNCNLIDSRPLTAIGTNADQTVDGVHRTVPDGGNWAVAAKPLQRLFNLLNARN